MTDTKAVDYKVTCTVRNTGKVAGKEVVQLYVSKPESKVDRPAKELKGFAKVSLNPGESKEVTIILKSDDLRYFDEGKHDWVLEPGKYTISLCSSETDVRQTLTLDI